MQQPVEPPHYEARNACVIVLHGLFRTERSMSKVARKLQQQGYHVVNQAYPSRTQPIEALAMQAIPEALAVCEQVPHQAVHFVTHSMGGILVRYYLAHHTLPRLGHVVMLGPPNGGSEIVDRIDNVPLLKNINGPAGLQLGTEPDNSLPRQLGPVDYSVGVIAGNRSYNVVLSAMIPGRDDGKVSVENAKVTGMADFVEMDVSHTFIMNNNKVMEQTLHFLETGRFQHQETLCQNPSAQEAEHCQASHFSR